MLFCYTFYLKIAASAICVSDNSFQTEMSDNLDKNQTLLYEFL